MVSVSLRKRRSDRYGVYGGKDIVIIADMQVACSISAISAMSRYRIRGQMRTPIGRGI